MAVPKVCGIETEYAVLVQIVNRDADPPSAVIPGYPPALEAIVMRALAKRPAERYQSAAELHSDLEHFRVRRCDRAGGVIHEYRLVA